MTRLITEVNKLALLLLFLIFSMGYMPIAIEAEDLSEKEDAVCDSLQERWLEIEQALLEKKSRLEAAFINRKDKMDASQKKLDADIEDLRLRADTNREKAVDAMLKIAESDEAKQAVEEYRLAIKTAIVKRRQVFDSVREEFRNEVEVIISGRQQDLLKYTEEFQVNFNLAFKLAQTACGDGQLKGNIRADFIKALQDARQKFKTKKSELDTWQSKVKELTRVRQDKYDLTVAEYEESMQEAREKLRAVLH